jgi:DNA segregation ATPase FtsK/SpoIIIE, S-DNA-T family
MRRVVTGEQVAQIYNPDPFARPVFRAPVYQTPAGLILLAWLARLVFRLARLAFRHPVTTMTLALLVFLWLTITWIGLAALAACAVLVLGIWWCYWPSGFARWVTAPARSTWRARVYRRRWPAVMTIADLAPRYRGRIILPVLAKVTSTQYGDRVAVRLVSGQCAADFAARADNLAHGFGAMLCRVRTARSGAVVLEFVRRDALAVIIPALPIPVRADLKALPVGRREDGLPWLVKLHGTHVLVAGATGAGKASLLWGLVRAMFPLMRRGLVRVLAADPKLMELAYGRVIQPDRKLRERVMNALATLTTQGRAVGYAVVAALQDPRKDVLAIRNLFPDRIAMRLDEPEQVDMVLGDGARDRGAACELISADPATGAGVAFVRVEADPDPVRVRAGWVTDTDIRAMAYQIAEDTRPLELEAMPA